jgi:hypothetical protein
MSHQNCRVALIIVEAQGSWPVWDSQPGWNPTVVEQRDDEAPATLVERVVQELSQLESNPQLAIIVCNERTDEAAEAARRRLVNTLLNGRDGTMNVVFAASERSSGTARRALAELASECNHGREEFSVGVWFGPYTPVAPLAA